MMYAVFIIQLIFLQQYFTIPVQCNITRYCTGVIAQALRLYTRDILATKVLEPVRSNGEFLGTLCEKRHDAVVVMDNKHFITLVSVHIALVGCIFTRLWLVEIPCPLMRYCTLTRVIRHIYTCCHNSFRSHGQSSAV